MRQPYNKKPEHPRAHDAYLAWRRADPPRTYASLSAEFEITETDLAHIIHAKRTKADGRVFGGTMPKSGKRYWVGRTRPVGQ